MTQMKNRASDASAGLTLVAAVLLLVLAGPASAQSGVSPDEMEQICEFALELQEEYEVNTELGLGYESMEECLARQAEVQAIAEEVTAEVNARRADGTDTGGFSETVLLAIVALGIFLLVSLFGLGRSRGWGDGGGGGDGGGWGDGGGGGDGGG